MRFDSWEAGLAFYRMYAHEVGFSVRVWTQHKGEGGVIIWKKFVCARQGWRKRKSVDLGQVTQEVGRKKAKRNIKISRCGCKAMMGLKRQDDNKYEVVQFVQSHTHQLVSPSKRHLIRSNREIASYKWLFQTFLKAMCGVAPKLVITDEDQSMRRGIESIFPNTKHRLCMWHILMKLPEKVGPILRDNEDFKPRFMACVRGSETPDEFESRWSSIISEFGLEDNEWLKEKYGLRESWIPAYFMEFSLGGILRTTSRSESENAFFRHFTNRKLTLIEFWVRFETALEEQRQKELQEDNCALHTLPVLETCWGIEAHAREVYTHNIFVAFQREVVAARDRRHVKTIERVGDVRTMSIGDLSGRIITVCFNTNTKAAQCTCRMFESLGILCSHIIVVLKNDGCNEIPSQYVLHRWTKMAARHLCYDANGHEMEGSSTSLSPIIKKLYSQTWSRFSLALHEARHCEEKMEYLNKVVADALAHLRQTAPLDEQSKVQEFESFIGTTFPSIINIHPPDIANTKGSGKRLKRGSEEAINKRKKSK
ncbi:protein FAR1-RELATED SEQUENCE 5 isoform X2 [Triticum aestivum]|uniref:protein FAR1-RELATED SEQUENCE 5 isoform X2 n=1 Tax=Triticum aestivum TaxID=4565 RepID=UPI000843FB32|nr:protein FAR1-RELATED SEQUENCE 5-like isoform X2 [Triticum aestivum]